MSDESRIETFESPPARLSGVLRLRSHPFALMMVSWIVWTFFALLSGLSYTLGLSGWALFFLAVLTGVTGLSAKIGSSFAEARDFGPSRAKETLPIEAVKRILALCGGLAICSIPIRIVGGAQVYTFDSIEAASNRFESYEVGGNQGIAVFGTPLMAFGAVGIALLAFVGFKRAGLVSGSLALIGGGVFVVIGLSTGSRTHVAVSLCMVLVALLLRRNPVRLLRILGISLVGLVGLVGLSSWVLGGRLSVDSRDNFSGLNLISTLHNVQFPDWAYDGVQSGPVIGNLAYAINSVNHYVVHGVYEFSALLEWRLVMDSPLSLGRATFPQWWSNLLGVIQIDGALPEESMFRTGTYTTLWGPFLADFGILGVLFLTGLLGLLLGFLWYSAQSGAFPSTVLYISLAPSMILCMFFSTFQNGLGFYVGLAGLVVALYAKHRSKTQQLEQK